MRASLISIRSSLTSSVSITASLAGSFMRPIAGELQRMATRGRQLCRRCLSHASSSTAATGTGEFLVRVLARRRILELRYVLRVQHKVLIVHTGKHYVIPIHEPATLGMVVSLVPIRSTERNRPSIDAGS